ncbi:unnamed protein product [Protopolystoma xenopodis]|uniref:Uncharacterized protein n=1 Tax=Protopolystoma xenopodis TaxID=117903 RepID=A0A3S5AI53_9PLAT|nr:unnamed protein product [Protopolystoma xenopodis]
MRSLLTGLALEATMALASALAALDVILIECEAVHAIETHGSPHF